MAWVSDEAGWRPVTDAGFEHDRFAIYAWRSVRANGDTKTEKSRRTLELPGQAAEALREQRARQAQERLAAGPLWQDHGLVFASRSVRPWTHRTSAGPSRRSPRRPGSGRTGRPGNCVTRSCPS